MLRRLHSLLGLRDLTPSAAAAAPARIDRQSSQGFARWGETLGARLGRPLQLAHTPPRRRTGNLQLVERVDYGAQVQAPTCVLRFAAGTARAGDRLLRRLHASPRLPYFEAGDPVGIVPPGGATPRFYSLASASRDGILEICVRHHAGGLCSGFLHGLTPAETVEALIQHNPQFRPAAGRAPVILIGAGTGIGPLTGFIRHNSDRHPMYLYWGGRNSPDGFPLRARAQRLPGRPQAQRSERGLLPGGEGGSVQDKHAADTQQLQRLVQQDAQILVCGGRETAAGVMPAPNGILAPLQLNVRRLQAEGRYREEVY